MARGVTRRRRVGKTRNPRVMTVKLASGLSAAAGNRRRLRTIPYLGAIGKETPRLDAPRTMPDDPPNDPRIAAMHRTVAKDRVRGGRLCRPEHRRGRLGT